MRAVFDERQLKHQPEHYFRLGEQIGHPEQPERAVQLRNVVEKLGIELVAPRDYGLVPIYAVHTREYVDFFRTAWSRWVAETGKVVPAVPNYHTSRRWSRLPKGIVGQLGYFSTDTACPVTSGTWEAIYWSAQSAIDAADRAAAGEHPVYALCRPPGHHAYRDASNGFCFFNNAAIAAERLRETFSCVAILDVDTHAGNGTQDIFYEREDVFVCSIHVNPENYPPHYMGYEDEIGEGDGIGAHLNLVLTPGDVEATILARLDQAIAAVQVSKAEAVVVSLGFDMAEDDPLSEVKLTASGFTAMAQRIVALDLPIVYVQEGGYLGPSLSRNAAAFFSAVI